jgi:hypothetical protein
MSPPGSVYFYEDTCAMTNKSNKATASTADVQAEAVQNTTGTLAVAGAAVPEVKQVWRVPTPDELREAAVIAGEAVRYLRAYQRTRPTTFNPEELRAAGEAVCAADAALSRLRDHPLMRPHDLPAGVGLAEPPVVGLLRAAALRLIRLPDLCAAAPQDVEDLAAAAQDALDLADSAGQRPEGVGAGADDWRGRLRLRIDGGTVLYDDKPVPLDMTGERKEEALRYLQHLLDTAGDWVSDSEVKDREAKKPGGMPGVRWDQVRKLLPARLRDLIETKQRKGSRLKPGSLRLHK